MTTDPNLVINFNIAQTFYIDPATVAGQSAVKISFVNLYFKYKPAQTGNRSGINNPGVTMYLTETIYGVPNITPETYQCVARAEYNQIVTSSDASIPTPFNFKIPVSVKPGTQYAIVMAWDGNEVFWPWLAKTGQYIVGTSNLYSGPTGDFIGKYYEYNSSASVNTTGQSGSPVAYDTSWRPLDDTEMKFDVHAVRFFVVGTPVANLTSGAIPPSARITRSNIKQSTDGLGHLAYEFPSQCVEQITFSISNSTIQSFIGAQKVYQNTVPYPGGWANNASYITVSCDESTLVTANSLYPNGAAFNWNDVYGTYTGVKYIVLLDQQFTNVRKVRSIVNSTAIVVDEPVTFTNNATKFIISPVATIDGMAVHSPRGKKVEFMWLTHSNANSTVRFVNNCIESIAVSNGGNLYQNSDILYIKGFQNVANKVIGGYVAVANIVTDANGKILAIHQSNLGCGFVNTTAIEAVVARANQVGNAVSNSSANGTGAVFTYTVGATIKTELTNNIFKNCQVVNLDVNDVTPFFDVSHPLGTYFDMALRCQYYMVNDLSCYDKFAYYVYPDGGQVFDDIQMLSRNKLVVDKTPCFVSFSNEFITPYTNGAINDQVTALSLTSNNFVLGLSTFSNNDFIAVTADTPPTIEFGKYIINDSYIGEETNAGDAWAKHLTTRINFTRLSEDIRVYLEAYKPANTDIQVYARIQNSGDPDAFDDAEWTRLQLIDGYQMMSSLNKFDDYIDLTYGFQPYPNTEFQLTGSVSTTNNSATITGSGTTFSANLIVNDTVRIFDPLFPNVNFIVATVNSIASNTSITIDQPINTDINAALVQPGMKIEKLGWDHPGYNTGEYIHQGYNNITFDNVVRYYNTSIIKYDGYDILQLKIVLLNTHLGHIPRIHNIRCIGVSA